MKKYIMFVFIMFMPIVVNAASIQIVCEKDTITVGDSVRCDIIGNDTTVGGAKADSVSVTNGTITSFIKGNCIELAAGAVSNSSFECISDEAPNSTKIVSYVLKSQNAGNMVFKLTNAQLVGYEYATIDFPSITKTITVKAKETTQATTKSTTKPAVKPQPSPSEPSPSRSNTQTPAQTEPVTEAPTTEVVTEPVEEPTSEVVRPNPKTDEVIYLKSLKVDGIEINFSPTNFNYNFSVGKDINELNITYEAEDDEDVEVSDTKLKSGLNKIYIVVTKGDISSTYTLNVTKESSNKTVKTIKIVGSVSGIGVLVYCLFRVLRKF